MERLIAVSVVPRGTEEGFQWVEVRGRSVQPLRWTGGSALESQHSVSSLNDSLNVWELEEKSGSRGKGIGVNVKVN